MLTNKLAASRLSCLMKAVCSAAASRCAPKPAKSASNFTRQLSQSASLPSKFGMPMVVPCVQNATCFSCHAATRAWSQIPSSHWITSSCPCERITEQDESSCFPSNSPATKCHSTLSRLRYHVWTCVVVKGMQQHVCFWHGYGMMCKYSKTHVNAK